MTRSPQILALCLLLSCLSATATVYDVGGPNGLTSIGKLPWLQLTAGDTVRIHYRAEPYREKWVICAAGKPGAPITFTGVPSPDGKLPVIEGRQAKAPNLLDYWNGNRGIIKIGGANVPRDRTPAHIVVRSLIIRGANPDHSFIDRRGRSAYRKNAAGIYIEKGVNILIENCTLFDCGNGLMVAHESRDITVRGCQIYGNGIPRSVYEHNVYSEANGITFEHNYLGNLRKGAFGNNLKDRSANTVIRYNYIDGGNRLLDLVDSEFPHINQDSAYRSTFVYGNIMIKRHKTNNSQVVHYGGDSGEQRRYRKGALYFINNTVLSQGGRQVTLFRLSSGSEMVDARNNIFHSVDGVIRVGNNIGAISLRRNWLTTGWGGGLGVVQPEDNLQGASPGFHSALGQEFELAPGSPCIDSGTRLPAAMRVGYPLRGQYHMHCQLDPRPSDKRLDIGAFEAARR